MINGELTSGELITLRKERQFTRLGLAFPEAAVVFSARIDQTFASLDKVYELTYDGGSGDYADILPGQDVWIGSAAGLADIGICRARKSASATKIFIGETSEVAFANDLYLTVVNQMGLWAKAPYQAANKTIRMDRDVDYDDQHTDWKPFVVMGADIVKQLSGATVSITPGAGGSWSPDGRSISEYLWHAPGAASTSGLTSATPTFTYNAAGTYVYSCRVTATTSGKQQTGYRTVVIWDAEHPLVRDFELTNEPNWSQSRGGWEFSVKMYAGAEPIRDRQKVYLVAQDYYDGVETTSIGPLPNSANIVAEGWIAGESIEWLPGGSNVAFDVKGAHWWLDNEIASMIDIHNTAGAAAKWDECKDLTVDKAIAHFLTWRTTASAIMDCILTGDTRLAIGFEVRIGSLWQQMNAIAWKILANVNCNPHNRLYVQIDPQYLTLAERADLPHVMTLTEDDWGDAPIEFERNPTPSCSRLEMVGEKMTSGASQAQAFYALAPGHVHKRHGKAETMNDIVLISSQSQLNTLSGLLIAQRNNQWSRVDVDLLMNNRAINGAPRQLVGLVMEAGDNPRGQAFSRYLIPREISYTMRNDALCVRLSAEPLTSEADISITGDIPDGPEPPPVYPPVDPPIDPPPPDPYVPDTRTVEDVKKIAILTKEDGVWWCEDFNAVNHSWWLFEMEEGQSLTDLQHLLMTPSGTLYVVAHDGVWSGTIGGTLTKILDQAWLTAEYPAVTPYFGVAYIGAAGVNLDQDDQIILMIGQGYIGTRHTDIWIGNSGGFTKVGTGTATNQYAIMMSGVIVVGDGAIIASYSAALGTPWILRASLGGVISLSEQNTDDDGAGGDNRVIVSVEKTETVFGYGFNGHLWWSDDGGITREQLDILIGKTLYRINKAVDFKFSGSVPVGLAIDGSDGVVKKSTDGGASWVSSGPTGSTGQTMAIEAVNGQVWLCGGRNYLAISGDFGGTWIDKSAWLAIDLPLNYEIYKIAVAK